MKNPTAQINGTLTAIWVVPNERDYQMLKKRYNYYVYTKDKTI